MPKINKTQWPAYILQLFCSTINDLQNQLCYLNEIHGRFTGTIELNSVTSTQPDVLFLPNLTSP